MKSTQSFPFSSYEHEVACDAVVDEYLTCVLEKNVSPSTSERGHILFKSALLPLSHIVWASRLVLSRINHIKQEGLTSCIA